MRPAILHHRLPEDLAEPRPLPGTRPVARGDWLRWDEAAAAQISLRRDLLAARRPDVLSVLPGAEAACAELEAMVAAEIAEGPWPHAGSDDPEPLARLALRVQEDFCILQKPRGAEEHILTAAILCFPASWRLSEKIGRPLTAIHEPVPDYRPVARRVQRLFDGLQAGRPVWRSNRLWYHDLALYQPRSADSPRPHPGDGAEFLRVERQCLSRLPATRAVVFSIHTYVVARRQT